MSLGDYHIFRLGDDWVVAREGDGALSYLFEANLNPGLPPHVRAPKSELMLHRVNPNSKQYFAPSLSAPINEGRGYP